jgi:biopolymer transport protein ExbD
MDVFTILVFFLLFNSAGGDVLDAPKQIKLPDSVVEAKPRETVVILVSPKRCWSRAKPWSTPPTSSTTGFGRFPRSRTRLTQLERNIIGISTKTIAESKEVTILADKTIPFKVLKKIMSTCTDSGYGRISLAVIQKTTQS